MKRTALVTTSSILDEGIPLESRPKYEEDYCTNPLSLYMIGEYSYWLRKRRPNFPHKNNAFEVFFRAICINVDFAYNNNQLFFCDLETERSHWKWLSGFCAMNESANIYRGSDHWKEVREEALLYYGYHCDVCLKESDLCVHHRHYKSLGCECIDDLQVLCRSCHARLHGLNKSLVSPQP